MSHSQEQILLESLSKQMLYFDENISDILYSYSNLAERSQLNKLITNYRQQAGQYCEGVRRNETLKQVWIGSRVTIRYDDEGEEETLTIVLPHEVNLDEGHISYLSPVGRQLLLTQVSHRIEVDSPAGRYWITVVDVEN